MITKRVMTELVALHEAAADAREIYTQALKRVAKEARVRRTALGSVVSARAKQREAELDATAHDVLRILTLTSGQLELIDDESSEPAA